MGNNRIDSGVKFDPTIPIKKAIFPYNLIKDGWANTEKNTYKKEGNILMCKGYSRYNVYRWELNGKKVEFMEDLKK